MTKASLTIASRESRLALWQAEHVRDQLQGLHAQLMVSILGMTTVGDQRLDRPLSEIGGKGLFTKELEVALEAGQAHLAVHSLKDVPMELAPQFVLAAVMVREDPRDAMVSNHFASLNDLPANARVGTSSLRRASQLKALFPTMQIMPLRGNLDTRLAKLDKGEYDAIILAAAGLKRLGLSARIRQVIEPDVLVPSPGQGALGIETMAADSATQTLLAPLIHTPTLAAVTAERMVSLGMGGNCKLPLAAHCEIVDGGAGVGTGLKLTALVASADGSKILKIVEYANQSSVTAAQALGKLVVGKLIAQGAQEILGA